MSHATAVKYETFESMPGQLVDLEDYRLQRRARLLGQLAVETAASEVELHSNDPLAPVFEVLENGGMEEVEHRVKLEFVTDMGERAKKRHFNKTFGWTVSGNDILADDSAMSYREMMAGGLSAARNEAQSDSRRVYSLAQAEIQANHLPMLLEWYYSDDPDCVMINSLCPEDNEVPTEIAELLNFKPDKKMASNWIFGKTENGIVMHAFSLDELSLTGLDNINQELGIEEEVEETALGQLAKLTRLPFVRPEQAVESVRSFHDKALDEQDPSQASHYFGTKKNFEATQDANEFVESKPEAYELYKVAVLGLADSLKTGKVSPELAKLAMDLGEAFGGETVPAELNLRWQRSVSLDEARDFMDYLRRLALPHYIYEGHNLARADANFVSGYDGIASAGAAAISSGSTYDNACPGAGGNAQSAEHSDSQRAAAMNVVGYKEFTSGYCPNCLPKPRAGKKVRAWRSGEKIGCHDCGHVVDVCTSNVVRRGKDINKTTNKARDWWEEAMAPVRERWQRILHDEKMKREALKQQEQDELSKKRQQKMAQTPLSQTAN